MKHIHFVLVTGVGLILVAAIAAFTREGRFKSFQHTVKNDYSAQNLPQQKAPETEENENSTYKNANNINQKKIFKRRVRILRMGAYVDPSMCRSAKDCALNLAPRQVSRFRNFVFKTRKKNVRSQIKINATG